MSERDNRGRRLYSTWSGYMRSLGHTTLTWRALGRMREAWRLVGDAAVGLPPPTPEPELDLGDPFDE